MRRSGWSAGAVEIEDDDIARLLSCKDSLMKVSRGISRKRLVWLGLALAVLLLGYESFRLVSNPAHLPVDDFVEYWAAGRLNLARGNPYAANQLLGLQQGAGWRNPSALMMWNPPWTFPLLMPFAMLPYPVGRLLWLMVNFAVVLLSADRIWRHYGGQAERRWVAWLLGFTFMPALSALSSGQISAFMLLGIVGFLHYVRRGQWWGAGAATVLVAIKPQFLYLFWIALLLWVLAQRRWAMLLGAGLTGLAALAIAMVVNPSVLGQYFGATAGEPPLYWVTPTLGSALRILFGPERHWLQFAPMSVGVIWLAVYWHRHGARWQWDTEIPRLLLVCVVTTSYGWEFDQIVLLVPVLYVVTTRLVQQQATTSSSRPSRFISNCVRPTRFGSSG
jgi:hypothetical protein